MDEGFAHGPPIARLLLLASRWFDTQLLDQLAQQGWPRLSPAQSLVFAYLNDPVGIPPAELARRLGQSRQATSELVAGLVRLDLVCLQDNPRRKGGRLVLATERGFAMALAAYRILIHLETSVFGARRSASLRKLLARFDASPGPAPASRPVAMGRD
ncbi:MarR family winged helix-turn-helix transcriptional regulator [Geodermatophilus nigrescens]